MKRAVIACAMLAIGLTAAAQTKAQTKAPTPTPNLVLVTVNGYSIMSSDVRSFYESLPPQYRQVPLEQLRDQLVERMIDQRLIAEAARKSGLIERPDIKRKIGLATQSVLNEAYLNERIRAEVTDAKVRDAYQKSIALERKREEVRAKHILVKTRAAAIAIIAEIKAGADFATLAKQKSTGPSGRNGGDLGFFEFKQMVPPFSRAAFALKPGEVTSEPVQTQFGWHVIKVEERRVAGSSNFEEAASKIRQQMTDNVYAKTVSDLRAKAKINNMRTGGSKIRRLP